MTAGQKVLTLTGTLLGMLLAALDQTIVATAGPVIQRELAMPAALYAWITTAYMVASIVLVPLYGKLSDVLGRRPVLLTGIGVFLAGSVLCGVAPDARTLILARAVQGCGAAALFTSVFAVIADLFPPEVRGRYTGLFAGVWGVASVVGPLIGGFLTDHLGWHWVFFVNLPVGGVAIAFIALWMPAPVRREPGQAREPLDVAGAMALAATVVPLLLALSLGRSAAPPPITGLVGAAAEAAVAGGTGYPWGSWPIAALLGMALVAGALFIRIERRARHPILDLRLFENVVFAWGNAAGFVVAASFFAGIVFLPLFLVNVVGLSATRSGLTLTPLTLGIVVGNVAAGQLVSWLGRYRPLMIGSLAILIASFVLMGFTLSTGSTQTEVTLKMIAMGVGLGPSIPLYTLAVQNAVAPGQIGVASASVVFFRQLGATVGVALLGTVFANRLAIELSARTAAATGTDAVGQAVREAFTVAISDVYRIGLVIVLLALALTLKIPERPMQSAASAPSPSPRGGMR